MSGNGSSTGNQSASNSTNGPVSGNGNSTEDNPVGNGKQGNGNRVNYVPILAGTVSDTFVLTSLAFLLAFYVWRRKILMRTLNRSLSIEDTQALSGRGTQGMHLCSILTFAIILMRCRIIAVTPFILPAWEPREPVPVSKQSLPPPTSLPPYSIAAFHIERNMQTGSLASSPQF